MRLLRPSRPAHWLALWKTIRDLIFAHNGGDVSACTYGLKIIGVQEAAREALDLRIGAVVFGVGERHLDCSVCYMMRLVDGMEFLKVDLEYLSVGKLWTKGNWWCIERMTKEDIARPGGFK